MNLIQALEQEIPILEKKLGPNAPIVLDLKRQLAAYKEFPEKTAKQTYLMGGRTHKK
jgi:hypothetical protein